MLRRHGAAALLYVLLSIAMTWPLARVMDRAVPSPGDPYINIWILDWVHWATLHQPLSLFDANAFYPARYSLAFSENLVGLALLLMPFRFLGASPITAYNIAVLGGFAFSGFAMYLLCRSIGASGGGSFAAGIFYTFLPFRFTHLPHVQHIQAIWPPLLLMAVIAYCRKPTTRNAVIFGALFLMNGLSNVHWFLFGSFTAAITFVLFWLSGFREWKRIALSTGAALVLLAPFLYPYHAVAKLYGMTRSAEEALKYSAKLSDWFASGAYTVLYRRLLDPTLDPERWLFPGFLGLVLALVAIWRGRRDPRVWIALVWIVIGVAGAAGMRFFFHDFLYRAVPGFAAVRAVARWALITYLGLAVLVALAVTMIGSRRKWVAPLICVLFLFELRAAPIRWYMVDPQTPDVYLWMRDLPGRPASIHLPMDQPGLEYDFLLRATAHHKPIVNGVSGFGGPLFIRYSQLSNAVPIGDEFVDELRRTKVDYVIVHADALRGDDDTRRAWLRRELSAGRLWFVRRFQGGVYGDWAFSTKPQPPPDPVAREQLERFLDNQPTYNAKTFGALDYPLAAEVLGANTMFSAFVLSPDGIDHVDFLLENGSVRVRAFVDEDPHVNSLWPWYPNDPKPRYVYVFPKRPEGVSISTDVEVEITDRLGRKTLLGSRWVTWP